MPPPRMAPPVAHVPILVATPFISRFVSCNCAPSFSILASFWAMPDCKLSSLASTRPLHLSVFASSIASLDTCCAAGHPTSDRYTLWLVLSHMAGITAKHSVNLRVGRSLIDFVKHFVEARELEVVGVGE